MASIKRKLFALEYPSASTLDLSDWTSFATLVLWLEEEKIRELDQEDRAPFRSLEFSDDWLALWREYLGTLDAPKDILTRDPFSAPDRAPLADWLAARAVGLEYADRASFYSSSAQYFAPAAAEAHFPAQFPLPAPPAAHASAAVPATPATASADAESSSVGACIAGNAGGDPMTAFADRPALAAAMAPLCAVLRLPAPATDASDDALLSLLREARRRVQSDYLHVAAAAAVTVASPSVSSSAASAAAAAQTNAAVAAEQGVFTPSQIRSLSSVYESGTAIKPRDLGAHAEATAQRRRRRAEAAVAAVVTVEGARKELAALADAAVKTGDAEVDAASAALRIMFNNDLRDLQHTVRSY